VWGIRFHVVGHFTELFTELPPLPNPAIVELHRAGMGVGSSKKAQLEAELVARTAEMDELKARLAAIEAERLAKEEAAWDVAQADFLTTSLAPAGSQALLGSGLGSAAGYTLRVVGRFAAFGIGTGFIALQTLSYLGYVKVDWRKVERDTTAKLDRDGDGKVTVQDVKLVWKEVEDVLAFNLPAGAGFTAGLLWGLGLNATKAGGTAAVASLGARVILPRVAVGGVTATGLPAAVIAAKSRLEEGAESPE